MDAPVCKFALKGSCKYGTQCRYKHVTVENATAHGRAANIKLIQDRTANRTSQQGGPEPIERPSTQENVQVPRDPSSLPPKSTVDEYFAQYPGFPYNPLGSAMQEFDRMCGWFKWWRGSTEQKEAHRKFQGALVRQQLSTTFSPAQPQDVAPDPVVPAPAPPKAEKKKRVRTRRGQSRPAGPNTPLDDFFAEFPEFDYNSRGSATHEFERMCDYFHWCKNDPAQKAAHRRFKDALVLQFNETYGTDVNSLRSWQALAEAIGIDPIPETLKECRAAVETSHVNIVDLVDARHEGTEMIVQNFATEVELSQYTISQRKVFPRENAYAGGLLRYLLRQIMHPDTSGARDSGISRAGRRLQRNGGGQMIR